MHISCRLARQTDAREIAKLFRISADGYADYTWSKYAKSEEDLLDVGDARFSRENTEFSYQNCILAENAGMIVGLLHSYPLYACSDIEKEGESENADPVFRPFIGMEVAHTLYIPGLAIHKDWRGQGIGSLLLGEAHRRAQVFNLKKLSLICFSSNSMALRFYQRHGFSILKETSLVPHPLILATGKALLMMAEKPAKV
jgi:ribosomal protein S18 acetylase RimI-like enzyme